MTSRVIEVDPGRFERWMTGFAERHGPYESAEEHSGAGRVVSATAADGAAIVATPFDYEPLGLVLVRRGGFAVGLARGGDLLASKVGSRHVQSRTAAGGWSQQRFARRRGKQADELVDAVVAHARRVLLGDDESPREGAMGVPHALVLGGDRALVAAALATSPLRVLLDVPRREFYDLPDPKRAVLETALRRGRAVRIALTEPPAQVSPHQP